jgi:hypothetical protein
MSTTLAARTVRLLLGVQVGVLVGVGACAAPGLFAAVPAWIPTRAAAGAALGPVFVAADTCGVALAALALLAARRAGPAWRTPRRTAGLLVLLVLSLLSRFVVDPALVARAAPLAAWHGVAVGSWAAMACLALGLSLGPERAVAADAGPATPRRPAG